MTTHIPMDLSPLPVDTDGRPKSVTDTQVWHDGAESQNLMSGELHLSFKTLTPTLVGNTQYNATSVKGAVAAGKDKVRLPSEWGIDTPVSKDKKIVEPLRLDDGRVAISGTSLKGMMMASIGAFLAAPMTRVAENSYSYRPNLDFPKVGQKRFRTPHAAIVRGWDKASDQLTIDVLSFDDISKIYFVQSNAKGIVRESDLGEAANLPSRGYSVFSHGGKNKIGRSDKGNPIPRHPMIPLRYNHGIDGLGYMAESFGMNFRGAYAYVLVPETAALNAIEMVINEKEEGLFKQLDRTIKHLSDKDTGHVRGTHPQIKGDKLPAQGRSIPIKDYIRAVKETADNIKRPNTLIYVELQTEPDGTQRVVSIGQNFRYRWRYRDSVRSTWDGETDRLRPILAPLPSETIDQDDESPHVAPEGLSAVRLLAGYASDENDPNKVSIGRGDFTQLAGRLAFNTALEAINPEKEQLGDRFLSQNSACTVPLKILGSPRSSAEMEYLKQTTSGKDMFSTYGDTKDAPPSELAGRKFYPHQPPVGLPKNFKNFRISPHDPDVGSDQSVIARYISKPGITFKVKLRYRDLRAWELGAVIAALDPARIDNPETGDTSTEPSHAQKLGKGRPYGMGSVIFSVDKVLQLSIDGTLADGDPKSIASSITALKAKIEKADCGDALTNWLGSTAYKSLGLCEYPEKEGRKDTTIFNHYTDMRRFYSAARRLEDNRLTLASKGL